MLLLIPCCALWFFYQWIFGEDTIIAVPIMLGVATSNMCSMPLPAAGPHTTSRPRRSCTAQRTREPRILTRGRMRGSRLYSKTLDVGALGVTFGLSPQPVDFGEFFDLLGAQVTRQI